MPTQMEGRPSPSPGCKWYKEVSFRNGGKAAPSSYLSLEVNMLQMYSCSSKCRLKVFGTRQPCRISQHMCIT